MYTPTEGISAGSLKGNKLTFQTGSGIYKFVVTGKPGTVVCANTTEDYNLNIACPKGLVITQVQFASFGTPYGECGNLALGRCHAGSSQFVVEDACLFKEQCMVAASPADFRDPCYGTPKSLATQVICADI